MKVELLSAAFFGKPFSFTLTEVTPNFYLVEVLLHNGLGPVRLSFALSCSLRSKMRFDQAPPFNTIN